MLSEVPLFVLAIPALCVFALGLTLSVLVLKWFARLTYRIGRRLEGDDGEARRRLDDEEEHRRRRRLDEEKHRRLQRRRRRRLD
jgi:hypothetical protein